MTAHNRKATLNTVLISSYNIPTREISTNLYWPKHSDKYMSIQLKKMQIKTHLVSLSEMSLLIRAVVTCCRVSNTSSQPTRILVARDKMLLCSSWGQHRIGPNLRNTASTFFNKPQNPISPIFVYCNLSILDFFPQYYTSINSFEPLNSAFKVEGVHSWNHQNTIICRKGHLGQNVAYIEYHEMLH